MTKKIDIFTKLTLWVVDFLEVDHFLLVSMKEQMDEMNDAAEISSQTAKRYPSQLERKRIKLKLIYHLNPSL